MRPGAGIAYLQHPTRGGTRKVDADNRLSRTDETIGIESIDKEFAVAILNDILQDLFARIADELPELLGGLPVP
ncbi:MAG TPA: hypothetical protein VES02_16660, partial [Dermatophilaceae bacterium]|nr:hypothetical protein [Dermatophilaceae bacterium]